MGVVVHFLTSGNFGSWAITHVHDVEFCSAPNLPFRQILQIPFVKKDHCLNTQQNNQNVVIHISYLIQLQFKSSLPCNVPCGLYWYGCMSPVVFVPKLFLTNTCLPPFKRVIQTSGQTACFKWRQHSIVSGLCLASKWRRVQMSYNRFISTLNWIN